MLYLEGELGSKEDWVGDHTKRCWSCRLRLEKIQKAISEFVEVRNSSLSGSPKLPRRALVNLDDKLARLEIEGGGPKFLSVLMQESGPFGLHVAPRAAIFVVLLGVLVLAFLRMSLTTPMCASELLARVEAAQSAELDKVTAPVLRERLRVRRKVAGSMVQATTDYDSWVDHSCGRYRQTGSSAEILTELQAICEANQLDWQAPLSAAGYARWRDSLPAKQDIVAPAKEPTGIEVNGGPEPLSLTTISESGGAESLRNTEASADQITEAELVVRTADWHPIEVRLWVDDREYEIAELDYKVLPLPEVNPLLFAEPPAPVEAVEPPGRVMIGTAESLVPPPPDPEETEMAVRYGLHQLDADLGEPLEISRDSQGKVIVDASSVAPEFQAKLKQQLASIPNASLLTDRPPSPAFDACPPPSPVTQETVLDPPAPALSIAPTVNPNEKRLGEIFGNPDAQESFTRETLAVSEDVLSHGFALRNLALRYPPDVEGKLTPIAKAQLIEMVNDHVEALFNGTNRLQGFLRPLLQALSSGNSPEVTSSQPATNGAQSNEAVDPTGVAAKTNQALDPASWQNLSLEIFTAAQKSDLLVWSLFASTKNPLRVDQIVPELSQALSAQLNAVNRLPGLARTGKRRINWN